jgi:predicted flap endonuclease-1-like 5' DNA nuclease
MSALSCCLWWFVLGVLIGWLLNWLLSKLMRKDPPASGSGSGAAARFTATSSPPAPAPATRSTVNLDAARRAGYSLRSADDIAVIDGIGPKIEELFRQHGVTTFAQVAKMSAGDMQKILDAGGPHFKLANPATWAKQAQLILDNKWDDLKTLHAELAAIEKAGNPQHKI